MLWKILTWIFLIGAIAVAVLWFSGGMQYYTKDKEKVVTKDELFGTESVEWKPAFKLGIEFGGPAEAVFLGGAFVFWRISKKKS